MNLVCTTIEPISVRPRGSGDPGAKQSSVAKSGSPLPRGRMKLGGDSNSSHSCTASQTLRVPGERSETRDPGANTCELYIVSPWVPALRSLRSLGRDTQG